VQATFIAHGVPSTVRKKIYNGQANYTTRMS